LDKFMEALVCMFTKKETRFYVGHVRRSVAHTANLGLLL
jgi:hypothetical protein